MDWMGQFIARREAREGRGIRYGRGDGWVYYILGLSLQLRGNIFRGGRANEARRKEGSHL